MDTTGEITVEVKRPWLLQRNPNFVHNDVTERLGWRIRVRKATTTSSSTIQTINYILKVSAQERSKQLRQLGDDIFRPRIAPKSEVSLLALGGFGQVGRSCMLLTTPESRILLDCGVNPGARSPGEAYPAPGLGERLPLRH